MLARCRKFLALATLFAGVFHASHILALGLGELTVNSSLNEPLDASIQLLGLDGLTEGQIDASLGGLEDFQRANINRTALIDAMTLEVVVFNSQQGILRLTSTEPVVEPFLSMVISVRWPTGRLMRDYTALIDLPLFISNEPQAVPVDVPQTPAPANNPEPVQLPEPEPQPEVLSVSEPEAPVVEAEQIAQQSPEAEEEIPAPATPEPELIAETTPEPDSAAAPAPIEVEEDTSAQQLVAEITEEVEETAERAEPEAEESVTVAPGNTLYDIAARSRPDNSVSVEQTMLAIQRSNPDAFIDNNINMIRVGQILRIPSIQEIQSIDQAQALNQIALQNQAMSVQPLAFSNNTAAGDQQGIDELTILSGEDGEDSLTGDSDMAETIAALENQLMISEENLDRARLENQELQARLAELREQVEILQNIISMQDARLAQLQADLAARNEEQALAAAAPQPVPVQASQADNSLMGQLSAMFENTLVLLSSLLGLILLVVGFLVWRRRAAHDGMDEFELGRTAMATSTDPVPVEEPSGASSGFLTAMKNRLRRNKDEDEDEDDHELEDAAEEDLAEVAAETEEFSDIVEADAENGDEYDEDDEEDDVEVEEDDEDDAVEDDEDEEDEEDEEEASTGLMSKLKGLFARSSDDEEEAEDNDADDEDDEDDEELVDLDDEFESEETDAEQEDDSSFIAVGDFEEDEDDLERSEELEGESADSLLDKFSETDASMEEEEHEQDDGEGLDIEAADDEQPAMELGDLDFDLEEDEVKDADEVDEEVSEDEVILEDTQSDNKPEEELDDDILDLGDFSLDETEPESKQEAGDGKSQEEPLLTERVDLEQEDESESFEFSLNEPEEKTAETEEVQVDSDSDLESFDFSLDDTVKEEASMEEASESDLESFEFNVDQAPEKDTASEQENDTEQKTDDLETLDFDVSSISTLEEKKEDQPAQDPEEEGLETFSFDSADSIPEAAEDGADKTSGDKPVELDIEEGSSSLDSLAQALGDIDTEPVANDDDEPEVVIDDEFDLGDISIDDSLFSVDEADEVSDEPITDRDESSTKLDLAVAYQAMGDLDGARVILNEVIAEGNDEQIAEAKELLEKWDQS